MLFRAATYLNELQRYRPDIFRPRNRHGSSARATWFYRLDETSFAACPSDSIDYAVMERTQSAAMVTVDIGWNDINRGHPSEVSARNMQGNALRGDGMQRNRQHFPYAPSRMVAAIGVQDLVIVKPPIRCW